MTDARALSPVFVCMAIVILLIILLAPCPTIDTPKILSDVASTIMRTIPVVSPSHMDQSLSANFFLKVLYLIRFWSQSFLHNPTEAISGEVNVACGMSSSETLLLPKNNAFCMTVRTMKSAAATAI